MDCLINDTWYHPSTLYKSLLLAAHALSNLLNRVCPVPSKAGRLSHNCDSNYGAVCTFVRHRC